jgi:hypothetical protein
LSESQDRLEAENQHYYTFSRRLILQQPVKYGLVGLIRKHSRHDSVPVFALDKLGLYFSDSTFFHHCPHKPMLLFHSLSMALENALGMSAPKRFLIGWDLAIELTTSLEHSVVANSSALPLLVRSLLTLMYSLLMSRPAN